MEGQGKERKYVKDVDKEISNHEEVKVCEKVEKAVGIRKPIACENGRKSGEIRWNKVRE